MKRWLAIFALLTACSADKPEESDSTVLDLTESDTDDTDTTDTDTTDTDVTDTAPPVSETADTGVTTTATTCFDPIDCNVEFCPTIDLNDLGQAVVFQCDNGVIEEVGNYGANYFDANGNFLSSVSYYDYAVYDPCIVDGYKKWRGPQQTCENPCCLGTNCAPYYYATNVVDACP